MDPRLNTRNGIVPHAFLRPNNHFLKGGKLKSMWEIPADDLYEMITFHIKNHPDIQSAFSSWTQTLETALEFALRNDSSTIAVLDTTHESMADRVWYTEDLNAAGLAADSYEDEFLVYGPVSGPNYHCISVQELKDTTRVMDIIEGSPSVFGNDRIGLIEREAVEASRQIATALQPLDTSSENIMILTARFVGVRVEKFLEVGEHLGIHDLHAFLHYVQDDIRSLATRLDARTLSLADQMMATFSSQALDCETQMLQAAENAIHLLGWGLQPSVLSLFNTTDQDQLEDVTDEMELD